MLVNSKKIETKLLSLIEEKERDFVIDYAEEDRIKRAKNSAFFYCKDIVKDFFENINQVDSLL